MPRAWLCIGACRRRSRCSPRAAKFDRVLGLKLGADDYLTKPFEMIELLARIEALLRRARTLTASSADAYSFGTASK